MKGSATTSLATHCSAEPFILKEYQLIKIKR